VYEQAAPISAADVAFCTWLDVEELVVGSALASRCSGDRHEAKVVEPPAITNVEGVKKSDSHGVHDSMRWNDQPP